MLASTPSRTAQGAALYRAAHQLVDHPLVFEDPLALAIVGAEAERALRAGGERVKPRAAAMRAFIAVRSRYAEDCFAEMFDGGVRQYVVLGAGLDTFAYRCRYDGVRVFEVDHPATQAWKRERLAQAKIATPERVTYAATDFEHETVSEGLIRAGLDLTRSAFFAWLGVTPYLTRAAITGTLEVIARQAGTGSEVAFDFAALPDDDTGARAVRSALAARVSALGEPLEDTFEPPELERMLRSTGFSAVEVVGSAALNARYLAGRKDGLCLRNGQMARARV